MGKIESTSTAIKIKELELENDRIKYQLYMDKVENFRFLNIKNARPVIIYNNIIPFKGFDAINLFGIIFARKEYGELSDKVINHEKIHTALMKELLYIPFYIIYGVEYIAKIFKYGFKGAYNNISFEKEAYKHERDLTYLENRKHYAEWRAE